MTKKQLWNCLHPVGAGDNDECLVTKEHIHGAYWLLRELLWVMTIIFPAD